MGRRLHLVYYEFPPSENHIRQPRWIRVRGKAKQAGLCYTTEAEAYRKQFSEYMRTNYFVALQKFRKQHEPWHTYEATLNFYFPPEQILNKGWLLKGKNRAKTPYKKMDVGNRRKLLEDCFASAVDIDDSLSFHLGMTKFVELDDPRLEIILESEDPACFGVPPEYLR